MGQGYSTKERQMYVPAEPTAIEDVPLYSADQAAADEAKRAQSKAENSRKDHFSQSGRRGSKTDREEARSGSLGANARNAHNDGEWMYNLDSLANEHTKKKRRSIVA